MNKAALDDTQAQLLFLRDMKERDSYDHEAKLAESVSREINYYRDLACEDERHASSLESKI